MLQREALWISFQDSGTCAIKVSVRGGRYPNSPLHITPQSFFGWRNRLCENMDHDRRVEYLNQLEPFEWNYEEGNVVRAQEQ